MVVTGCRGRFGGAIAAVGFISPGPRSLTFTEVTLTGNASEHSALGNYRGPTPTHPLLTGSAALDGGDAAVCLAWPVSGRDQRGFSRLSRSPCDIGAYEASALGPRSPTTR